jgi:hypothetical protein
VPRADCAVIASVGIVHRSSISTLQNDLEVRIDWITNELSPAWSEFLDSCDRRAGLEALPNDLTRMLYLSSLRDCNSGRYLHPQFSASLGVDEAHRVLSACHDRIFLRLLTIPVAQYVFQLEEYIRYARTERNTILMTWQSLEAYRATVPVHALPVYRDIFSVNVEIALVILEHTLVSPQTHFGQTARGWS